jgi:hypothetical protein
MRYYLLGKAANHLHKGFSEKLQTSAGQSIPGNGKEAKERTLESSLLFVQYRSLEMVRLRAFCKIAIMKVNLRIPWPMGDLLILANSECFHHNSSIVKFNKCDESYYAYQLPQ